MNPEFRTRILLPIVLPLGLVIGIGVIAFSLSRVLLAVPQGVATALALLAAAYVLGLAFYIGGNRRLTSGVITAGLAIGFVAIVAAGAVAAQAGMRDIHHDNGEPAPDNGPVVGDDVEIGPDDLVYVADQLDFVEFPTTVSAGEVTFVLDNQDGLPHNLVIDETGETVIDVIDGGSIARGTTTLEAGEYTIYCSVPGHRATMEEPLTVE